MNEVFTNFKKGAISKDNLIIAIVIAVIILAVVAIMCYSFLIKGNEVLATFDGGKVTRDEYELYYRTFSPVLSYYGYDTDAISKYVAEKIILDKILYERAIDAGLEMTEEDKAEVDEIFNNEDNLNDFTSRQIDVDALRKVFYNDTIITAYIEKLTDETTEESMRAYIIESEGEDADFNIYTTRHILFATTDATTEEEKAAVKAEAEAVLARIKAGEDFATLAAEFSDDTYTETYSQGLYTASANTTVSAYFNALKSLKVGEYTKELVVDETYGYFIIKVEEINENGRLTDETEKDYFVDNLLQDIQDNANCVYNDERINAVSITIAKEFGLIKEETETDTNTNTNTETDTDTDANTDTDSEN